MGKVKDAMIAREDAARALFEGLAAADSAIEQLLTIGFLSDGQRERLEGYQAGILTMLGDVLEGAYGWVPSDEERARRRDE